MSGKLLSRACRKCAVLLCALLPALISIDCARSNETLATADIVIGTVNKQQKNGSGKTLSQGMNIRHGDVVHIGEDAKVKLALPGSNTVYVNENSKVQFNTTSSAGHDSVPIAISLPQGECYSSIEQLGALGGDYSIVTPYGTFVSSNAHFNILCNHTHAIISTLHGDVTFVSLDGDSSALSRCKTTAINSKGRVKTKTSLSPKQIRYLKKWVGTGNIERHLAVSDCQDDSLASVNKPPEWIAIADSVAQAHRLFSDTVRANDPDGDTITYSLLRAPKAMSLDSISGILKFMPDKPGMYTYTVIAKDRRGAQIEKRCRLRIKPLFGVVLDMPSRATPGNTINARASLVSGSADSIMFRFDMNGDGVWDYPSTAKFGSAAEITHTYTNAGTYAARLQARNQQGERDLYVSKITVNGKPSAQFSADPSNPLTQQKVTLNASASHDPNDHATSLSARWIIEASSGEDTIISTKSLTQPLSFSWKRPDTYRITLIVNDPYGVSDTAADSIRVSGGISIDSLTCADTITIDTPLKIRCHLAGSAKNHGHVVYSWRFGDEKDTTLTTDSAAVVHHYDESASFTITCIARDTLSRHSDTAKVTATVRDMPTHVEAGGPYSVHVNETLYVDATVSDSDSKIVSYSWDFNNDGKYEWLSKNNTKAHHVYMYSDTYHIAFQVHTARGKAFSDTTRVVVVNTPPRVQAGEDILAVNPRTVKLNGKAMDPDGKIIRYEWDFDGDGDFDWSSQENGSVNHRFTEYTWAIFRATDSDSAMSRDSLKIIICPENMIAVPGGKYCIDIYEYPNRKGVQPRRNVIYEEAVRLCAEKDKHLCTQQEWTEACQSNKNFAYPYGNTYNVENCNTLGNSWVSNELAASGEFSDCKCRYGAMDMSGNVAEWVYSEDKETAFAYGGSWQTGERTSRCTSRLKLDKSKSYFYIGFRCCK